MRPLAGTKHAQRHEREQRHTDYAENELECGHGAILRPHWLAAAWGITCGMAYTSFFGQLARLDRPDPSSLPAAWVVGIKGVGFLLAIVALAGSLRQARRESG
jgi:hypothetical protein